MDHDDTSKEARRERQRLALLAAAGTWDDPSQERLDTEEGVREFLEELRRPSEERRLRLERLWRDEE